MHAQRLACSAAAAAAAATAILLLRSVTSSYWPRNIRDRETRLGERWQFLCLQVALDRNAMQSYQTGHHHVTDLTTHKSVAIAVHVWRSASTPAGMHACHAAVRRGLIKTSWIMNWSLSRANHTGCNEIRHYFNSLSKFWTNSRSLTCLTAMLAAYIDIHI